MCQIQEHFSGHVPHIQPHGDAAGPDTEVPCKLVLAHPPRDLLLQAQDQVGQVGQSQRGHFEVVAEQQQLGRLLRRELATLCRRGPCWGADWDAV